MTSAAPGRPRRYVAGLPQPDRCLVMGVVNVTPDSFSDGGLWAEPDAAVRHGLELMAAGADIVDIGGESTRPGATRPSVADELDRVLPVVRELSGAGGVVSIDTMRAEVARAAVEAGAVLVNDVSGGRADPDMHAAVAELGVAYVVMHWRDHSVRMHELAAYDDVVVEVADELRGQVERAMGAGIAPERLCIDPGLGFAKVARHNWELLQRLAELEALELPLMIGASRKSFLGELLADDAGTPRPATERDHATASLTLLAAQAGAWCVRAHEVDSSLDAAKIARRMAER